ncbi:unnamed protein product [Owenia fusiformis]|uniref:Uncharacterized protein n=1 Tax=Owenia fusiformis TaxID=6347 RepID=A0A8J1XG27_OWEFU|nr:unnamed protein product [Owenia fusiformis]
MKVPNYWIFCLWGTLVIYNATARMGDQQMKPTIHNEEQPSQAETLPVKQGKPQMRAGQKLKHMRTTEAPTLKPTRPPQTPKQKNKPANARGKSKQASMKSKFQTPERTHDTNPAHNYNQENIVRSNQEKSGPTKCEYAIVVNEIDSRKCPTLLQGAVDAQQDPTPNKVPTHQPNVDALKDKVQEVEKTVLLETLKTDDLSKSISTFDTLLKQTQNAIENNEANITHVQKQMAKIEKLLRIQKLYYKNIDSKIGGLMLDFQEVTNTLEKHQLLLPTPSTENKTIAVESVQKTQACGITNKNVTRYRDCVSVLLDGFYKSGIYYITPIYAAGAIPVWCDMDTPPGGWMVIQRRIDDTQSFNKGWKEYREGFGDVSKNFWLGLDNMFLLTNQKHYSLRVDLWDFFDSRVYAEYKHFYIDGQRDRYKLHVANHTGSCPDGLSHHNGVAFSTPDQDNDAWADYHCGQEWVSGWWFNNCWFVILNGQYYNSSEVKYRGISWNEWKQEQLQKVEMKIRPTY